MPAAEIVASGAKRGLVFSIAYVYTVRSNAGARLRKANAAGAPASKRERRAPGAAEGSLRNLIAELGLARSRAVLSDVLATFGVR